MSVNYLLGKLNLGAFRYCVLGRHPHTVSHIKLCIQIFTSDLLFTVIFLICNALVASTSVWNLDLVRGLETSNRGELTIITIIVYYFHST